MSYYYILILFFFSACNKRIKNAEMSEVASLLMPADHRIATVKHYEAGPPPGVELVSTF